MAKAVRYNIPPEVFVTVWEDSPTVKDAAERLSLYSGKEVPRERVLGRAAAYRRAGVVLKRMTS